jgi:alanine racemase
MSRVAKAILSTDNLLHNLEVIKQKSQNCKVIAMIKANAYGHGLRSTAQRLENHVYSFGVASIDEALELRKIGIKIPITLMAGAFEPDDLLVASCQNFHVIFHDQTQIDWLRDQELPNPLNIWLKIDTGMGRLGFSLDKAQEKYQELSKLKQVASPINIISHLACADEKNHPLNHRQVDNFNNFIKNYPDGNKSLANSATIFNFSDNLYDIVRPGLSLYGFSPIDGVSASDLGLKPVMTLKTKLINVETFKKGHKIGYGARFECPEDMKIGIVAIGYGDGYPRTAKDTTPVLVNGVRCSLAGRVSMDMVNIDLRNYPDAKVGDVVTLWGEGLPLEEVAIHTDNVSYDIICAIQHRVKFLWTALNK